jgi:hypothetical protein
MKKSLLIIAFLFGLCATAQPPTNYVMYYDFDNSSLADNVNSGTADLTANTSAFGFTTGFDAMATSALQPNTSILTGGNFPAITQESSYSFWVKFSPAGNDQPRIMYRLQNPSVNHSGGVDIYQNNLGSIAATVSVATCNGGCSATAYPSRNIADNTWHHVAVVTEPVTIQSTFTGYKVTIYLDGTQASTDTTSGQANSQNPAMYNTNPDLTLNDPIQGPQFAGEIDDLKIFDYALSSTQVTQLFNPTSIGSLTYVDVNATGANDGSSWADAFTSLDTVLNASNSTEVWVAAGTYTPSTGSGINVSFKPSNDMLIYGGFNGTETMRSQRDFRNNITILSGDIQGNDDANITFDNATRTDNAAHVIEPLGENVLIDGFTISGGNATGSGLNSAGGAINAQQSLTINNCIIEKNVSEVGNIRVDVSINIRHAIAIRNSVIRNNTSRLCTVYYATAGSSSSVNTVIDNCLINNNQVVDRAANNLGVTSLFWFRSDNTVSDQQVRFSSCTIANNNFLGSNNAAILQDNVINATRNNGSILVTVANSIFNNNLNEAGMNVQQLGRWNGNFTDATTSSDSNIVDLAFTSPGNHNNTLINAMPGFVDGANDDFSLLSNSIAIDAGVNVNTPSTITQDLNGDPRIQGARIDIGAYEFGSTAGINDVEQLFISLYPNPASDILHVTVGKYAFAKAEIYNLQGQQVAISKTEEVQVQGLKTGMYVIKVTTQNGDVASQQFIKK